MTGPAGRGFQADHPDLIPGIRERLCDAGVPWVVENVERAPIRPDFILCGSQFELSVQRHRWFETSWHHFALRRACIHAGLRPFMHKAERAYADAMDCAWMTNREARQAIPPAYTEHIGGYLMTEVLARRKAKISQVV